MDDSDLIKTNKNRMIFKTSQKLAKKSHGKDFEKLHCSL